MMDLNIGESMNKISMVFCIAGMKSRPITYRRASEVAEAFTVGELIRLYILTKARMS